MAFTRDPLRIVYLERDPESASAFLAALRNLGTVDTHSTVDSMLRMGTLAPR